MTQVPEAYEQAKKHTLFIIIASQQKSVTLNSRMNSANKAICYAEVINITRSDKKRLIAFLLFKL